ncbi:MAG TPA: Insertion element protein [Pseudonocardia sp.]|nr:Insertion element protein [Pseudonocardia sp.]
MTSTERAVPFYCPYCGEEDLRPVEEPSGAWRCAGCLRTFAVKFVGIGVAEGAVSE